MKLNTYAIKVNNDYEVYVKYREDSASDKNVILQIFQEQEYNIVDWVQGQKLFQYHNEQSAKRPSLIIDAGANIGISPLYFSIIYPKSFVFTIEPDEMNFNLLTLNTKGLDVFNFHGAIADADGEVVFEDPDRSDWGFTTRAVAATDQTENIKKVNSICPTSILSHPSCQNTTPLICKIDIEGGEDALFRGDTDWMDQFPLIIIELHDWMLPFAGTSRNFIKAAARYDFDLVHKGENIFLFNRRILGF